MPGFPSSQRGRHRKPTTTTSTLAKTALAGAVVGAPLITAGQAQAAPDNVWDKVAQCESGGNWGISTGNGFQGGLQFTESTWRSFGGSQFAASANKASREQQIAVAEKVLAGQGWNAWPVCSRKAGATGTSATQRVITTKGPAKSTERSEGKSIGKRTSKKVTAAPRSTGRHALKAAVPAPKPLGRTPAIAAQPPAPAPVTQLAARLSPLVGPALPSAPAPLTAMPLPAAASAPRPAAAPAAPAPAPAPAPQTTELAAAPAPAADAVPIPAPRTYQVHVGDTLSSIASSQAVTGGWQAIYNANRGELDNANVIRPGQKLALG